MRSKRWPRTGSSQSPSSQRTFSTPLRRWPKRANESACGLTSRPTTRSACRAARSAWTPEPVPRSSAVSPSRRTVRPETAMLTSDRLTTELTPLLSPRIGSPATIKPSKIDSFIGERAPAPSVSTSPASKMSSIFSGRSACSAAARATVSSWWKSLSRVASRASSGRSTASRTSGGGTPPGIPARTEGRSPANPASRSSSPSRSTTSTATSPRRPLSQRPRARHARWSRAAGSPGRSDP